MGGGNGSSITSLDHIALFNSSNGQKHSIKNLDIAKMFDGEYSEALAISVVELGNNKFEFDFTITANIDLQYQKLMIQLDYNSIFNN